MTNLIPNLKSCRRADLGFDFSDDWEFKNCWYVLVLLSFSVVKAELLKRMFRAIATDDEVAVERLLGTIVEEERQKGHTLLAEQLENIAKQKVSEPNRTQAKAPQNDNKLQSLSELPTSKRLNIPLVTVISREHLRHHMILTESVEKRFQRIEREYAGRDRLAHHGFRYRQKILLYGSPGCGKTLGAERLAWNTGLPLLKVHFDAMVSSYLGETASNLRQVFEMAAKSPCLLLLDECDAFAFGGALPIAKSRQDDNMVNCSSSFV